LDQLIGNIDLFHFLFYFMTIFYFYALSFIALSGFGIVFLNAESILAACFFIFFAFILQNAGPAVEGLDTSRQAIGQQLASSMYLGQFNSVKHEQLRHYEKAMLLPALSKLGA
jgi:hypothetical protein